MNDNLFFWNEKIIFRRKQKIIFLSLHNELSEVSKTCIYVSNGQKFELLIVSFAPELYEVFCSF